jgi:hypothetical protein
VLDKKHAALGVEDDAAHAERQPAGKSPIDMQHPAQRGLERAAYGVKVHV